MVSRTDTRAGLAARAGAVAAGIALDRLLGEPPQKFHPVARFGSGMVAAEKRLYADTRVGGAVYAAAGTGMATAAGLALSLSRRNRPWQAVALATYLAVAGRELGEAARSVAVPLVSGDLAEARAALPALVGRDPCSLDEAGVARAVVESVAENTVDAVIAPALWAAIGGAPAVLGYRAVNTLDAMVGHRSPRYARFGWAAARLDDLAAWMPARLTAALVAAVRPGTCRRVARAVHRQAPLHPSPNAGVAEAAFAAALGVTLGGTNVYGGEVDERPLLGDGPEACAVDIERAVSLSRDVTAAFAAALAVPAMVRTVTSLREAGARR